MIQLIDLLYDLLQTPTIRQELGPEAFLKHKRALAFFKATQELKKEDGK